MLDIHTHILPGVDDGARSMQEAEAMLTAAQSVGITEIVATPHLTRFPLDHQKIQKAYDAVEKSAYAKGIRLWRGYEVYFRAIERLDDVRPYCVQWEYPEKVMLLEFREPEMPERAEGKITQWVRRGIRPIIVHPERYLFVQRRPEIIQEWRNYGCLIQVDAGGLAAPIYTKEHRTAHQLIKMGVVDLIASDAHRPAHFDQYGRVMQRLERRWTGLEFEAKVVRQGRRQQAKTGF